MMKLVVPTWMYALIIVLTVPFIPCQSGAVELKLVGIRDVVVNYNVITSPNGEYSILIDWDTTRIGLLTAKKLYFKSQDKCLWEKENPIYIFYFISDTGVVGYIPWDEAGSRGELGFFDRNGNIIHKVSVEYFTDGSFSPDGSLFGAQTIQGLLIFNSQGKEVWKLGKARKFDISTNGEKIVSVFEDLVQFYHSGKLTYEKKIDTPFIKDLVISLNSDRVAIISKTCAYIFDTQQGNMIWRSKIEPPETYISVGKLNNNEFCFLVGKYERVGDQMLGKGRIEIVKYVAHLDGYRERSVIPIDWGEGIPKFYSKGNSLFLRTRSKEWEFKIIE